MTLTASEMLEWTSWKRATDRVWDEVAQAIAASTGLSTADFAVLTRAAEAERAPRQQDIADQLGWSRSRLSRQLSRMEKRGLLLRAAGRASTLVEVTDEGRTLVGKARLAHADAVRAALLAKVPTADADAFWRTVDRLSSP